MHVSETAAMLFFQYHVTCNAWCWRAEIFVFCTYLRLVPLGLTILISFAVVCFHIIGLLLVLSQIRRVTERSTVSVTQWGALAIFSIHNDTIISSSSVCTLSKSVGWLIEPTFSLPVQSCLASLFQSGPDWEAIVRPKASTVFTLTEMFRPGHITCCVFMTEPFFFFFFFFFLF